VIGRGLRSRVAALVAVAVLAACSGGGGSGSGGASNSAGASNSGGSTSGSSVSRPQVLADLADHVIVPHYQALQAPVDALSSATQALCAAPDETTLTAARSALGDAREAWETLGAMWVGAATVRRSFTLMDSPITPDDIEALVASDTPPTLDAAYIGESVGSDQRGLRAVEYVLGPDASTLPTLTGRRCEYLVSVATVIRDHGALLLRDWTEAFNSSARYRDLFSDPDNTDRNLDMVVNNVLSLLKDMVDDELGRALGLMGDPDIDALVEGDAGLGVADLQARVSGIRAVLVGDDTAKGLGPLLGDDLTGRLRAEFDAADAALAAIDPPLREAVAIHRDDVQNARAALQAIQVTVNTEVVSNLGITVGFGDVDGDGSG
jgi:predicted lipoprotein